MNAEQAVLTRHEAHAHHLDMMWMTLPLIAMGTYLYGLRVPALCVVALAVAHVCDRLVALLRHVPFDKSENSSLAFALVLTLMLPATVPYYVLVVAVVLTVLVAKAAFGGYSSYVFFPPAVGFATVSVSWPDFVLRYPAPFTQLTAFSTENAVVVDGAAHTLAAGGLPNISLFNLLLGNFAGPMGTTAMLVIISCGMYLWMRKRITLAAPLAFVGTCVAIAYLFPRLGGIGLAAPWHFVRYRLLTVAYELLSGPLLYSSVFLINDPVTLPKSEASRFVYGVVLALTTMMYRYYGSYDLGLCFALLWVNALRVPIDRAVTACSARIKRGKKKEVQHNG